MDPRHDAYWAKFLGVQPADWRSSGILFRKHAGLRGYRGVWCFRRAERVVVSAPQAWVARLEERWADWEGGRFLDAAAVQESLGEDCERCIGPAFHGRLVSESFVDIELPQVRTLAGDDRTEVDRFRQQCGPDAWSASGLNEVAAGHRVYLDGPEITAMAGLRELDTGVGDLCVLTAPLSRSGGRGAAVVRAVTRDALARGTLVLYQTLEANRAAVALARSLGFARYGSHLAVRLKHDEPSEQAVVRG